MRRFLILAVLVVLIGSVALAEQHQMNKYVGVDAETLWVRDGATIDSGLVINGTITHTGLLVSDSLEATLSLECWGLTRLGNAAADYIYVTGNIITTVLPKANDSLALGSTALGWDVWATDLTVDDSTTLAGTVDIAGDLTSDGAVTLGDGGDVVVINSSDWDIDALGNMSGIGTFSNDGAISSDWTGVQAANISNILKITYSSGDTFTGTQGHVFKVYDADNTVLHGGGEACGVYVNMKLLKAPEGGCKSVLYSGHNYGSGGDYQIIDAGVWLYGNLVDGFKVSGGSIETGLDLSETAVTGEDIEFHNGATINNVDGDSLMIDENFAVFSGNAKMDALFTTIGSRFEFPNDSTFWFITGNGDTAKVMIDEADSLFIWTNNNPGIKVK